MFNIINALKTRPYILVVTAGFAAKFAVSSIQI